MNMNSAKSVSAKFAYHGLFSGYPPPLPELPCKYNKLGHENTAGILQVTD